MSPDDMPSGMYIGESVRARHNKCSQGKSAAMQVTRYATGWYWYCHRCKKQGWVWSKGLTPSEARMQPKQKQKPTEIHLPSDFTNEIPVLGEAWLESYELTRKEIKRHNFGYSKRYDRLVMPIYRDDKLIYWTGRYLGNDQTKEKYYNVRQVGSRDVYFDVENGGDTIVYVEDIISAIKVGRVCDARSILGSYVRVEDALRLPFPRIGIWLDYDKRYETSKFVRKLKKLGVDAFAVYTTKDPKCYDDEEIERKLNMEGNQ